MPESYDLHDGRFLERKLKASAANATELNYYPVPANKVWTFLGASYVPSAAETRVVTWFILTGGDYCMISRPVSILLGGWARFPLLEQGMELKLFPGEILGISRDVATAGSTMTIFARIIETDLPPYDYVEPQERKRITAAKHSISRSVAAATVGGGSGPLVPPGRGGGRGGSEPY